ncbi:hypothetical protein pdam_00023746, partial [Pocillopora damicornis]
MRQILIEEGYEDAKEYFICLSDGHPQCWDILGSHDIISAETILSAYESEDGYREIKCDCCQSTFQVQSKYVKGDPPNIAFV